MSVMNSRRVIQLALRTILLGFGSNAASRQRLANKNLDFGVDTP